MTGDRFVILKKKDGKWYWELHKTNSPYGAIAEGVRSYPSPSAAERSIKSALSAFKGAAKGKKIRIEKRG